MKKVLLGLLCLIIAVFSGCGDEGEGFANPLQVEITTVDDETEAIAEPESPPLGSVTGRILFADNNGQILAHALTSSEYVTFEGESTKTYGKDIVIFVDFPDNMGTYLIEGGYFHIKNVGPGSHGIILMSEEEAVLESEDNYAKVEIPEWEWIVDVKLGENTAMGTLTIPLSGVEWISGEAGKDVSIPEKPKTPVEPDEPVVPTKPVSPPIVATNPLMNPKEVANGHVYLFDDVKGNEVSDDSANNHTAIIMGDPQLVPGLSGTALKFDGMDDAVHILDSGFINATNGPWANRTVMVVFSCLNVNKGEKQTIYEEGGTTRGINIYIFRGEVYVGIWNRAEYNANLAWEGSWPSATVRSNEWHAVGLVLRDAPDEVAPDRFEMWMDGQLVAKEPAGQIYNHTADIGIGDTNGDTYFHDGSRSGSGDFFEGIIDEVWIINEALKAENFKAARLNVEPIDKLVSYWGRIRVQR